MVFVTEQGLVGQEMDRVLATELEIRSTPEMDHASVKNKLHD
jgi:hypothetical protein